ncbi:MAG TPA: prenyltransferase [candidate division Zixibacteria bacterium]|nr:prenyltransferase [candidate division Zixibacteria bacterium]
MTRTQSFFLYFRMSRSNQHLLIAAVYAWGVLVAIALPHTTESGFDPISVIAPLVPLILISASIHYANEYADHETDALTVRTPYSGGSGALRDYSASPKTALMAAWVSLISGSIIAIVMYATGYLPFIVLPILAVGAFGGWMYSLRPLALAWRRRGEIINAFLGGILLPVMGYAVYSARVDRQIILLTLPFALLAFDNLLATTWSDRAADEQVGKFTLATMWSTGRLRKIYFLSWTGALLVLLLSQGSVLPVQICWACFLILPAVIWADRSYTRK